MIDPFASLSAFPSSIRKGQYVAWTHQIDLATGVSLKWVLRASDGTGSAIEVTGSSSGMAWAFVMTGAETSGLARGANIADLVAVRDSDSETTVLSTKTFNVTETDADRRSHARVMIQKIESILENRADDDVSQYSIKNRSITKMSVKELTDWREFYRSELASEPDEDGATPKPKNTLKVGFI